jgi:3-oxoacyl-[acyl-carrier protein] reductase
MMLEKKIAVVYGGGGVFGGAAARAFAREGATVYLAGRTRAKLEAVARDIRAAGGVAHVAEVDVLDPSAVARHVDTVVAEEKRIDVCLNAVGFVHVQGTLLNELSLEDFEAPIRAYSRAHFIVAKAVSRPMVAEGSGVIMTLSTPGSRLAFPGVLGFGFTCAGIEALTRHLACELGPNGVRVLCLRPDVVPEAVLLGSHAGEVFRPMAEKAGYTAEQMAKGMMAPGEYKASLLKRTTTVAEVANTAAFMASAGAGAITGAIVNLSCGSIVD